MMEWNWERIMYSGRLYIIFVEPLGSTTREFAIVHKAGPHAFLF
jgi:hypothetical protein